MSVYIKGMEMPKSCYDCPLRKRIGLNIICPISREEFAVADVNILFYRLGNCPLVPVPPHGRLIDADANIATLQKCEDDPESELAKICYGYAKKVIAACPTIIPAGSEGTE